MAKKKRTQLKPVARGFATTSVPKKAAAPAENEDSISERAGDDSTPANQPVNAAADTLLPPNGANGPSTPAAEGEFSFEKAEEHSLQVWIEKQQEKTEREIARTLKVCQVRRGQPSSTDNLTL